MEIIIRPDASAAVELVSSLLSQRIRSQPDCVLGLATGRTMEQLYESLARQPLSFRQCSTFNLDEYVGLTADDPQSYRHYMQQHLFSKTDIDLRNTHVPDGSASDLKQAASDYEQAIQAAGGIDVQLLGIGEAGHIGFNEPLSAIMSRTRDKCLTPTTRRQNAGMFGGDAERVPSRALTMGVGTILDAREIILLATGKAKAAIIAQAVEGPITSMVSASALQLHPNCKVIVDDDAASGLQGREYYDFVFDNEPEWADFRP
ncbi:glucosamine-6-phosphate deaminase [Granulosicoccus sp. 3-233]|uniref:glucosamine-6-phosphate deaminase n=1 Tax=Granulosicoccus sp. 3-233 TaxID=3417969 RepID=UPI003D333BA0